MTVRRFLRPGQRRYAREPEPLPPPHSYEDEDALLDRCIEAMKGYLDRGGYLPPPSDFAEFCEAVLSRQPAGSSCATGTTREDR